MKLYNTLSRKLETLSPIESGKVKLYTCGPTVYDFAHIGNLRTYVFEDLLRRSIEFNDFKVNHVMNITDVDDKTIKAGEGKKSEFEKLTKEFEEAFFSDLEKLNIKKAETITHATKFIEQMVNFVKDLLDKGFAYKGDDGSIYFSIKKFKDYGKLSKIDLDELKSGARVNQDEYSKNNPSDFALWKAWDEKDGEIFWDTELGKGRPGWHIECSAMSMDKLGETLDIHTGGVDNIFPHHENEIAQSEARTGKEFAKMWIHGEHLLVDGKKMSKSLGNFYKLKDIVDKGFSPLDFRYLVLQSHYRSKLNFTWEALEAARNSRMRLIEIVRNCNIATEARPEKQADKSDKFIEEFKDALNNDLNSPEALSVLWKYVRDDGLSPLQKFYFATVIDEKVLQIGLSEQFGVRKKFMSNDEAMITVGFDASDELESLVQERSEARENDDYSKADELKKTIEDKGYRLVDAALGPTLYKK